MRQCTSLRYSLLLLRGRLQPLKQHLLGRNNGGNLYRWLHGSNVYLILLPAALILSLLLPQAITPLLMIGGAYLCYEGAEKVYVQHRLKEHAADINALLEKEKAYFYICGDAARMAREVNDTLVQLIADQRGIERRRAEEIVKSMRATNQLQEDVWS